MRLKRCKIVSALLFVACLCHCTGSTSAAAEDAIYNLQLSMPVEMGNLREPRNGFVCVDLLVKGKDNNPVPVDGAIFSASAVQVNSTSNGIPAQPCEAMFNISRSPQGNLQLCAHPVSVARFPCRIRVSITKGADASNMVGVNNVMIQPYIIDIPPNAAPTGMKPSRSMPRKEDYTTVRIADSGNRTMNYIPNLPTIEVTVKGVDVVLDDHWFSRSPLSWDLSDPPLNVYRMNIFADTLTIAAKLHLPMANILVKARLFTVVKGAFFKTTPVQLQTVPSGGQTGASGLAAGNITAMFDEIRFEADNPSTRVLPFLKNHTQLRQRIDVASATDWSVVFDASGGVGQKGGTALVPASGTSYPLVGVCGGVDGTDVIFLFYHYGVHDERLCNSNKYDTISGTLACPTNGADAPAPGTSGAGGNAGYVQLAIQTLPASLNDPALSLCNTTGGAPGPAGDGRAGGTAGTPRSARFMRCFTHDGQGREGEGDIFQDPRSCFNRGWRCPMTQNGASSPPGPLGASGSSTIPELVSQTRSNPSTAPWLSDSLCSVMSHYIRDLFFANAFVTLQGEADMLFLTELYSQALQQYALAVSGSDIPPWVVYWGAEFQDFAHKLRHKLDLYGHKPGYAPHLSLEANLDVFSSDIDISARTLSVATRLLVKNDQREAQVQNAKSLQQQLSDDIKRKTDEVVKVNEQLHVVQLRVQQISQRQQQLADEIKEQEIECRRMAEADAEKASQLPIWEKALKVAAAVGVVFGTITGQPEIAAVAQGVDTVLDMVDQYSSATDMLEKIPGFVSQYKDALSSANDWSSKLKNFTSTIEDLSFSNPTSVMSALPTLSNDLKSLSSMFKATSDLFKTRAVPQGTVDALYSQYISHDQELAHLIEETKQLQMASADCVSSTDQFAQQIVQLVTDITQSTHTYTVLQNKIDHTEEAVLDDTVVTRLNSKINATFSRLMRWQYSLEKSFGYRCLDDVAKFRPVVDDAFAVILNNIDESLEDVVKQTKIMMKAGLYDVVSQIVSRQEDEMGGSVRDVLQLTYTQGDPVLNSLNSLGRANFSLDYLMSSGQELVRVLIGPDAQFNISFTVDPSYKPKPTSDRLQLIVEPSQPAFVRFNNEMFYSQFEGGAFTWAATKDMNTGQVTISKPAPTQDSLISFLMENDPDVHRRDVAIRENPNLWTTYHLSVLHLPPGPRANITSLSIQIPYQFTPIPPSENECELYVQVQGDSTDEPLSTPLIWVSSADLGGKSHSYGPQFMRVYPCGTQLKLEAPALFSGYEFNQWEVLSGQTTQRTTALSISLDGPSVVTARYSPHVLYN